MITGHYRSYGLEDVWYSVNFLYNPPEESWQYFHHSCGFSYSTATLLPDGEVLLAGGREYPLPYSDSSVFSIVSFFDPEAADGHGGCLRFGEMNHPRAGHTATLLPSGKVLVTGGTDGESRQRSCELYDIEKDTWTETAPMLHPRSSHTATLLPSGKVLVAGGRLSGEPPENNVAELYDPLTGGWSATGPMVQWRRGHTATLLPSGKVLVAGGYGTDHEPLETAELYDPETNTWEETGSMNHSRARHTATLLPTGEVLVTGGDTRGSYDDLASAELYDPEAGTWAETGSMSQRRASHTATLLPSGKVLVVGGEDYGFEESTGELYDSGRAAGCRVCPGDGSCTVMQAGVACGLCRDCDDEGDCSRIPEDDPGCGVIDCDGLDDDCRDYHDLERARCAGAGRCKLANDPRFCTEYTPAPEGSPCDDGDEETFGDACTADGLCVGVRPPAAGCGCGGSAGGTALLLLLPVPLLLRRGRTARGRC